MSKLLLVSIVTPLMFVTGCRQETPLSGSRDSSADLILANCESVQQAAETFASENNGIYPLSISSQSLEGNTLLDLLPGGERLTNPITRNSTEPVDLTAVTPGQTGYRPYLAWDGQSWEAEGYVVTGYGESERIVTLSHGCPDSILVLEEQVIDNCYTLRAAVEVFATENGGLYPKDVDSDLSEAGQHTVQNLLPGGAWLVNPMTQTGSEPVNSQAAVPGETGYEPLFETLQPQGYHITGFGQSQIIIVIETLP